MSRTFGQLRAIRDDELALMLNWRNAPAVRANMYTKHEISLEEHHSWWARTKNKLDQRYFMFELQGVCCGIVGFSGIDQAHQNSSWAFYASPDAPKGTGSKMEFLALEFAFGDLGLHKLHCEVLAFNEPVIRLHQKYGFKIEGIFREHHQVDGEFVDIYRLGILRNEWAVQRELMHAKLLRLITG